MDNLKASSRERPQNFSIPPCRLQLLFNVANLLQCNLPYAFSSPSQRAEFCHAEFSSVVKSPLYEWGDLGFHYIWPKVETYVADKSNKLPRIQVLLPVQRVTESGVGV